VWFGTVLRGDIHRIVIGPRSNVQDGSVVHLADDFGTAGGGTWLRSGTRQSCHACTSADEVLIGMGAVVRDGAEIGAHDRSSVRARWSPVAGRFPRLTRARSPGKVVRTTFGSTKQAGIRVWADRYVEHFPRLSRARVHNRGNHELFATRNPSPRQRRIRPRAVVARRRRWRVRVIVVNDTHYYNEQCRPFTSVSPRDADRARRMRNSPSSSVTSPMGVTPPPTPRCARPNGSLKIRIAGRAGNHDYLTDTVGSPTTRLHVSETTVAHGDWQFWASTPRSTDFADTEISHDLASSTRN
jgi:carbonic anhydrase/acetyltransferase-like protein (isoleucine patch superfamily)